MFPMNMSPSEQINVGDGATAAKRSSVERLLSTPIIHPETMFGGLAAVTSRLQPKNVGIAGSIEEDEGFVLWSWGSPGEGTGCGG